MRTKFSLVALTLLTLLLINLYGSVIISKFSIVTAKTDPIFSDGFESGDFSAWNGTYASSGSTVNVVSAPSPVYDGTYSAHLSNGAVDTVPYFYKDINSIDVGYARVYVLFGNLGFTPVSGRTVKAIFMVFGMAANLAFSSEAAVYNNNGSYVWGLDIQDDASNHYSNVSSQVVSPNTWYCVEIAKVASSTAGGTWLYINGVQILGITGITTATTGQCNQLLLDGETYGQISLTNNYFDSAVIDSSYIGPEPTSPPSISILSPGNTTYTINHAPLTFTINETPSWMGYSLDAQTNVTISGNTTLTSMNDGQHQVTVYANNTAGNMGSSETVYFTVQTTAQVTFDQIGVTSNFNGTIITIDEANYSFTDLPVSFKWSLGSNHTFAFQSPLVKSNNMEQYLWTSTTGLSNLQNAKITITAYGSIIGTYKTQYQLTVTSPYGTVSGQGWYDSGSTAHAVLSTGVIDYGNGTRQAFVQWSQDASGTLYSQSNPILINGPKNAVATWTKQYLLEISTNPSGLSKAIIRNPLGKNGTSGWWYNNSIVTSLDAQPVANYTFDHWVVDGTPSARGVNPITVIMNTSHTVTAYYVSPDIAVLNSTISKTVLGRGSSMTINMAIKNLGIPTETITSAIYANTTLLTQQTTSLAGGNILTISYNWSALGFAYGNYTIKSVVSPVPGETDVANNNYTAGRVAVTIIGDINYDHKINVLDLILVALHLNQPAGSGYTPYSGSWYLSMNCDLNSDGKINVLDLIAVATHLGQHW